MEALLQKRKVLKGRVTRIETVAAGHRKQPLPEVGVQLYLGKVQALTTEFDELQDSIVTECKEGDFVQHEKEYNELIKRIEDLSILFMTALSSTTTGKVIATTISGRADVKLPRLELPVFHGKYENWLPFHDMFTATVHNNQTLSGAQKFHYLKSAVQDEAAMLIQSIPVTDANYTEAWEILMKRFNNNREIIDAHVKRLFNQPNLTQESANSLRHLIDTTTECVRALKVLKEPVQHWDAVLIHIVRERLDHESRRQWELSLTGSEKPTFEKFTTFLEQRARALAAAQAVVGPVKAKGATQFNVKSRSPPSFRKASVHHGTTENSCIVCNGSHAIFRCPTFLKANILDRKLLIKKYRLCFNCLKSGHQSSDCQTGHCKKCAFKHNTLIHHEQRVSEPRSVNVEKSDVIMQSHISRNVGGPTQVLLSTAMVQIKDVRGQPQLFRALLDSASQASFITERCAQKLQLKRKRVNVSVAGIGSAGTNTCCNSMEIQLGSSVDKSFNKLMEALILPKVTGFIPNFICAQNKWSHLQGLQLADPNFHTPGEVDVLIGADVYSDVLESGLCRGMTGTPSAFNTVFGWAITGSVETPQSRATISAYHCNIDRQLEKFWELEELPSCKILSKEEKQCEQQFKETHFREATGRYVVRLPFRNSSHQFGDTRKTAMHRFLQVERRLQLDPSRQKQYNDFMKEYLAMGHMAPISYNEDEPRVADTFYLPHHAVIKAASSTTKLRVVFDASVKAANGVSLNDELLVGPRLQEDLICLLIRFRVPPIVMTADLAKMYRQIWIHPEDANYQRILWRNSSVEPVQDFQLLTVTYGTAAAPYLAVKVLQQLAQDEGSKYPLAAPVLKRDFYMDDLMTGVDTIEKGLALQKELMQITQKAGFELRKWASNETALLESLPDEMRELQPSLKIDDDESIKTLGLHWHPASDLFAFVLTSLDVRATITKRTILSDTAKVFDPLGLVTPVLIRAKFILQELWQLKLDWDDDLPSSLKTKWSEFRGELSEINSIRIQRCITQPAAEGNILLGYCDASEKGYAAVVYLQTSTGDGNITRQLVAAKTRVAPLKTVTLARLELCGAVLLTRLIRLIHDSLKCAVRETHAFSDSTIVLAWLASPPQRWKTFVANRVAEIQECAVISDWHHVPSEKNPADCASRGISAKELVQHPLWWHGPQWHLDEGTVEIIMQKSDLPNEIIVEERKVTTLITQTYTDHSLLSNYSSLSKLTRVTAFVLRFVHNVRCKLDRRRHGPLSVAEVKAALGHWIRITQLETFAEEIQLLKCQKELPRRSKLLQLRPFLDSDGVLRVGGRLRHAQLTPDQTHPVLLPKNSKLTELLINAEHWKMLHGGAQLIQSNLQRQFWILGARDVIRRLINKCITCVRHRAATGQQIMGDLPSARVNATRPFLKCGVDFAGPFLLRVIKGRGHKRFKAYMAIFVCFATRAIHLELVSDLSTPAFLAALKRFVARRGKCSDMFSDCGTNFVGAQREMKEFMNMVASSRHEPQLSNWMLSEGIEWHFNPPSAPHFGGLWEAGVKSVKFHLKRVIGSACLTFEEMQTLLCQIEACLNSRPLTALSTDPSDMSALTPGHFLIGDVLTAIPEADIRSVPMNRLSRWQLGQQLLQHFWRRWRNEYLSRLQQRPKWLIKRGNFSIGELVLIKDENLPPTKWKLGRVVQLHPGADEVVRVVTVRTNTGELKRPIVKLCPLPID